jgi:CBS domain-containing membrane protein
MPTPDVSASTRTGVALRWLRALWPAPVAADRTERLRVMVGAFLGIGITALLCRAAGGALGSAVPWLVAPLGASAVLVFGVPASPLAQPWAVIGGNTVSALVGVACVHAVAPPELAAALAVGLAIGVMFALRCLHPPGGASALLVALSGVTDPAFAAFPVLANSLLLVLVGMAYNTLTRRAYPQVQGSPEPTAARDDEAAAMDADLDAVLARYNQVLDVSREDLKALLQDAQMRAYQRKLANLRCSDIMSTALVTVSHNTPSREAWALFNAHHIKALPVVDGQGGIVGIVTPADFLRSLSGRSDVSIHDRLRLSDGQDNDSGRSARQTVGQFMTRKVRVASEDRHLSELIPLFGGTGHHHIPIVNASGKLVGMVTQSDVVTALSRAAAVGMPADAAGLN